MKRLRLFAAVLLTAVILSGCTTLSLSSTDMLTPPRASGSLAEIQRMIKKDAKGSYELIYPTGGDNRNGIIRHDLDGDGTDDAVALYIASDGTPRFLAARGAGSYQLIGSAALHSVNISEIIFTDLDADGKEEIVVSFDAASPLAAVQAFRVGSDLKGNVVAEGYADFVIGDFDGDEAQDLLILGSPSQGAAKASLMMYSDGSFSEKSSCDIDAAVSSYISLTFCDISEGMCGAAAEGKLPGDAYTTQLLYYDTAADLLVNPLFLNESYSQSKRSVNVISMDVDADGVIEVPVCTVMDHTEAEDPESLCNLVSWCSYDPELMALSVEQTAILCEKLGFALQLSAERLASVTARYSADNAVSLYRVTYSKTNEPILGKEQLTVKRYPKTDFDSTTTAEAVLYEDAQYVFTYIITENSPVTNEEVENSFIMLEADDPYNNQQTN